MKRANSKEPQVASNDFSKKCNICGDILRRGKYSKKEHYENYHAPPKFKKDGSIQLNGVHQITLILKGDKTWEELLREEDKRSKKFKKRDESSYRSIEQLKIFEKENNIKFDYDESKQMGFYRN